jgi:hypothetical protein
MGVPGMKFHGFIDSNAEISLVTIWSDWVIDDRQVDRPHCGNIEHCDSVTFLKLRRHSTELQVEVGKWLPRGSPSRSLVTS